MPKFTFALTRDATETTMVEIVADTIEEAQRAALLNPPTTGWTLDDGNDHPPYIPDPSDYEED